MLNWFDRWHVGWWAMLVAGVGLIGLAVLVPAWLAVGSLAQQQRAMTQRLDRLQAHQQGYDQFVSAVQQADPLLLQRLAWHQLHLKPAGMKVLDDHCPAEPGATQPYTDWLNPAPDTAPPPEAFDPPDSRLARLTTTDKRLGLIAAGLIFIFAGLFGPVVCNAPRSTHTTQR